MRVGLISIRNKLTVAIQKVLVRKHIVKVRKRKWMK